LTILSPIVNDPNAEVSHSLALRKYLSALPHDSSGLFAKVVGTHMCRLVVLDDVIYPGLPTRVDHLKSSYLVFEANLDGDPDPYLERMARDASAEVDAIWSHCEGYPGINNAQEFARYMRKCQLTTTFYFADVNDKTVGQTLRALQVQAGLATFIERNQGKTPAALKGAFFEFWNSLSATPPPAPGRETIEPLPCFAPLLAPIDKDER